MDQSREKLKEVQMQNTPNTPQTQKQKPVHEIRLGFVKAAVWKHDGENGPRYSVAFQRIYKEGETWRWTESFNRDDLLLLAKVANETHSWIFNQSQSAEESRPRPR